MGKIIFDMPNRKLENAVKEKIVTQQVVNLRFKELLSRFDQDLKRKGL
tara:strand:+ start:538 stop:681 length:144 start_codon:yes stop_codon:yes gene_type:complete